MTIFHDDTKVNSSNYYRKEYDDTKVNSSKYYRKEYNSNNIASSLPSAPPASQIEFEKVSEVENETKQSFHMQVNKHSSKKLSYPAIPVKIKLKGKSKIVDTYMGLDTFSSACFMDLNLASELGINYSESQKDLDISTMFGKNKITTYILNNLEVYDLTMNKVEIIETLYCKKQWPFTKDESPSHEDISGLDYLQQIPFKFIDAKIGILIGMNKSEMLKPHEIIEGPYNYPFAVRYSLGWTIQGNTPDGIPSFMNLRCHRTQILENDDNLFEKYCQREFSEKDSEEICESVEDKKFKEQVEKNNKGYIKW